MTSQMKLRELSIFLQNKQVQGKITFNLPSGSPSRISVPAL